jgi:hypothetical protein
MKSAFGGDSRAKIRCFYESRKAIALLTIDYRVPLNAVRSFRLNFYKSRISVIFCLDGLVNVQRYVSPHHEWGWRGCSSILFHHILFYFMQLCKLFCIFLSLDYFSQLLQRFMAIYKYPATGLDLESNVSSPHSPVSYVTSTLILSCYLHLSGSSFLLLPLSKQHICAYLQFPARNIPVILISQ